MSTDNLTALDRLIGWFSPQTGLDRLRSRAMMAAATGGYKSARKDRRQTTNWSPGGGSADADLIPDLPELRARSRDLVRNMPLAAGAIRTMTTHSIGVGLVPHPSIDRRFLGLTEEQAADWEREAEREFAIWAQRADLAETMCFDAMQELAFRSALESGDTLVIRRFKDRPGSPYALRLQMIEADRICNPSRRGDTATLAGGVQTDASGRHVAYHVTNRHPGDMVSGALEWRRVPARYTDGRPICLHVIDRDRIDQSRGQPYLAPVIESLRELEKFTEAELRAAVVSALFTIFIEREGDMQSTFANKVPQESTQSATGSTDLKLDAGAILDLDPGEKANVANPGRPNPAFDPFVMAILRQIGVALELPFELLVKHFTASYSASRAALEMAHMSFKRRRVWLVRTLCAPVWEMVIEEAVARGRLTAPGFFDDPGARMAWLKCDWIGPARPSLDPLKDAKADEIDVANHFKTIQQVCSERTGGDWERKMQQRSKEVGRSSDLALPAPKASPDVKEDDNA